MLVKEVDLEVEQIYLVEANRFYRDMDSVLIPQLFPFSSDTITAMSYMDGPKITDADLDNEQRKHCADVLFEALICEPLFSRRKESLLFPIADRPENYPSLISNIELQSIIISQYIAAVRSSYRYFFRYLTGWNRILGMPVWPVPTAIPVSNDRKK